MADDENLKAFLKFYQENKSRLEALSAEYSRQLRKDRNPLIRVFMQDLADLGTGGKMLRGVLVNLGYCLGGGKEPGKSDRLALAFEMFQTGVLIHDDVIDNADTRRGKFTIHHRYACRLNTRRIRMVSAGENVSSVARSAAVCTGDLGIYYANKMIADAYPADPALGRLISCFDEIAIDTMRGELLDVILPYELQDPIYTEEERKKLLERSVRDIYHLKTARYSVIGPVRLGMMLAGADEKAMKAADRFADDIGIAYQIMDDILGIYADAEVLGKDVGSDISEFKQTILWMYVYTMKPEYAEKLKNYYGATRVTDEELEAVRRIFEESGALDYARDAMNACFARADRKISRFTPADAEMKSVLHGFVSWCRGRRR